MFSFCLIKVQPNQIWQDQDDAHSLIIITRSMVPPYLIGSHLSLEQLLHCILKQRFSEKIIFSSFQGEVDDSGKQIASLKISLSAKLEKKTIFKCSFTDTNVHLNASKVIHLTKEQFGK